MSSKKFVSYFELTQIEKKRSYFLPKQEDSSLLNEVINEIKRDSGKAESNLGEMELRFVRGSGIIDGEYRFSNNIAETKKTEMPRRAVNYTASQTEVPSPKSNSRAKGEKTDTQDTPKETVHFNRASTREEKKARSGIKADPEIENKQHANVNTAGETKPKKGSDSDAWFIIFGVIEAILAGVGVLTLAYKGPNHLFSSQQNAILMTVSLVAAVLLSFFGYRYYEKMSKPGRFFRLYL